MPTAIKIWLTIALNSVRMEAKKKRIFQKYEYFEYEVVVYCGKANPSTNLLSEVNFMFQ